MASANLLTALRDRLTEAYHSAVDKFNQFTTAAPVNVGSAGKVPLDLGTATELTGPEPGAATRALGAASLINPTAGMPLVLEYLKRDPAARKQALRTAGSAAQWFNPAEAGVAGPAELIGAELTPLFFSALKKLVQEKFGKTIEGQQARNTLFSVDPKTGKQLFNKGVTADEWRVSKLDDLLKPGQKYAKEDILKQIDQNTPQLEDVKYSNLDVANARQAVADKVKAETGQELSKNPRAWENADLDELREIAPDETYNYIREMNMHRGGAQFDTYVEPGGANQRELFVTAPDLNREWNYSLRKSRDDWEVMNNETGEINYGLDGNLSEDEARALIPTYFKPTKETIWVDGHEAYKHVKNPIVRLRMNDRLYENPNGRWVQQPLAGNQGGAITPYDPNSTFKKDYARGDKTLFIEEAQPPNPENQAKMPPELIDRWREIAMKRALKYAVDNSYDRIAWTTGQMQIDRYPGVEKTVDAISTQPIGTTPADLAVGGDRQVFFGDPNTNPFSAVVNKQGEVIDATYEHWLGQHLSNILPVDLASKVMADQPGQFYSTPGLQVGGRGLRRVYDEDLGNTAKKLGAKIESTDQIKSLAREGKKEFTGDDRELSELLEMYDEIHRYTAVPEAAEATRQLRKVIQAMRNNVPFGEAMSRYSGDELARHLGGDMEEMRGNTPKVQSFAVVPLAEKAKKGFPLYELLAPVVGAGALLGAYQQAQKGQKQ